MADGLEEFSWQGNLDRVAAGFKSPPFFNEPVLSPALNIGESFPAEITEKLMLGPVDQPTPTDPWVVRRPNGNV